MSNQPAKKIFLVDDQENWRKLLRTLLEQEGYEVQESYIFDDAKKKISNTNFDLLILDLRLVDEDTFNVQGLELVKIAKAQAYPPAVIIFTGYPETIREGVPNALLVDALMYKVPKGSRFKAGEFMKQVKALLAHVEK